MIKNDKIIKYNIKKKRIIAKIWKYYMWNIEKRDYNEMKYLKSRVTRYNFWIHITNFDSIIVENDEKKILFGRFYMIDEKIFLIKYEKSQWVEILKISACKIL